MLVLSRRPDEKILLPSVPAVITVLSSGPGAVRLGIDAPPHVPILREEIRRQEKDPIVSATVEPAEAPNARHHLRGRLHSLGLGLALLRVQLSGCSDVVRHVLDGMEQEMEALRVALAPDAGTPEPQAVGVA